MVHRAKYIHPILPINALHQITSQFRASSRLPLDIEPDYPRTSERKDPKAFSNDLIDGSRILFTLLDDCWGSTNVTRRRTKTEKTSQRHP